MATMLTRCDLENRFSEINELLHQSRASNADAVAQLASLEAYVRKDLDYLHKRVAELIVQSSMQSISPRGVSTISRLEEKLTTGWSCNTDHGAVSLPRGGCMMGRRGLAFAKISFGIPRKASTRKARRQPFRSPVPQLVVNDAEN